MVTWSVDRVRAMPWFGEENMQWVKAVAFTALDFFLRARAEVVPDKTAVEVQEAMADLNDKAEATPHFTDPESGWPPEPIKPMLSPGLPGEGQWVTLEKDPFITQSPTNPAAFVTTFVRPERPRPSTRVFITLWDPRQISLHMEAGTVEPVSASGEAGPGVIPRTPEVLKTVVAGFNGGFQAMHGEFGMQANGILYLPPKPYAATVFELRDGTSAFGSWPRTSDVPDEVLSYRQNMTALVEGGKFNPWGRTWWGGTPKGWADNIHTTRSGLCLTKAKFVGYFWGVNISAEVLADSMLLAGCTYGVHLDMNPGLAGFEFYNVQTASNYEPLGRPLQPDWETEGTFRDLPDFRYRARRMIRTMQHQNFPQYIHRDARDFFYLTRRPVLPGAPLPAMVSPSEPSEGQFRIKGLPQHGFPPALGITTWRPDATLPGLRVRVVRVDPRTVKPDEKEQGAAAPTVLTFGGSGKMKGDDVALWLSGGVFLIGSSAPAPGATLLAVGAMAEKSKGTLRGAVGIHDEDGMLHWVEPDEASKPSAGLVKVMDGLLGRLGCSSRMMIYGDAALVLGDSLDTAGNPTKAPAKPLARLVRDEAPGARAYFEDTAMVAPSVWQALQAQRVRYFRKPPPKRPAGPGAQASGASSSSPAPASLPAADQGDAPGDVPSPSPSAP
jgi:hypothetical protein